MNGNAGNAGQKSGPPIGPQPCGCVTIANPSGGSNTTLCLAHALGMAAQALQNTAQLMNAASLAAGELQKKARAYGPINGPRIAEA